MGTLTCSVEYCQILSSSDYSRHGRHEGSYIYRAKTGTEKVLSAPLCESIRKTKDSFKELKIVVDRMRANNAGFDKVGPAM
jgi:hypothetical protein